MPKKVSEKEKQELVKAFFNGQAIEELADKFNISKITITRHLKKEISEYEYKEIIKKNKKIKKKIIFEKDNTSNLENFKDDYENNNQELSNNESSYQKESFLEITPLNCEIDNAPQKILCTVPISEVVLPSKIYMVVDKKIELETKYLKEYPEWEFLSQEELERKTIEIYFDLKAAKRSCNKEQKVIKVPNTKVFKIATPSLLNKGISRIVAGEKLIAL